jgi:tryptophan halogenase
MAEQIRKIVIAGGGTAGWMTAAWFSSLFKTTPIEITLIENDEIGTVGVGEATTPYIHTFNRWLGIDENEFLKFTRGTFKLGIQFVDWGATGSTYYHAFGANGRDFGSLPFHSVWLRAALERDDEALSAYNLQAMASANGKFMRPEGKNSPLAELAYAFHFDASLYARFLRRMSEKAGVTRVEGKIHTVNMREDGFISSLSLEGGQTIDGDLFLDCTGFRSLLLGEAMGVGFTDWSQWLPCDRALAVPTRREGAAAPYTRSTCKEAGWQWRIPLQHRDGNGLVFSSAFQTEEKAVEVLREGLEGPALAEPRRIKFTTGRRDVFWQKNCVAIGLSAGFLEPLESTSIMLIQSAITRLQYLFPDGAFEAADIRDYNVQMAQEYDAIRDFLILHYKQTSRTDSELWRYCSAMPVPDSLQQRIDLFEARGRIPLGAGDQFRIPAWFAVMWGQGLRPRAPDPLSLAIDGDHLTRWLSETRDVIAKCCDHMPPHDDYIRQHCLSDLSDNA